MARAVNQTPIQVSSDGMISDEAIPSPPNVGFFGGSGGSRIYFRDCPRQYNSDKKFAAKMYSQAVIKAAQTHTDTLGLIEDTFQTRRIQCYVDLSASGSCLFNAETLRKQEIQRENEYFAAYVSDLSASYKKRLEDLAINYALCCSSDAGEKSCGADGTPIY